VGTGLIWGVWHWPVILWSTYHSAAPLWYTLVFFTLMTVALSFLFSWLRLRSKSVWPCALLHASHNVWVQAIFTGLTVATAESKWWIDNFGAMVPLVTLVFAAVVVARDGLTATAAQD
jgi:membrane protease YdiL (CAAX protease family)